MFDKIIKACVGILPEKLQKLYYKYEEQLMYAFFGALTTLISIITKLLAFYAIPGERPWESTFAVAFSWVCAVTFAFFTNKKYVFKNEKKRNYKAFIEYFLLVIINITISGLLVTKVYNYIHLNATFIKVVIDSIIFIINYFLQKLVIFRKN